MAVQHNKWSQFEHEGHIYRVRLVDCGWSFTRFQIQKQTNTRRKYVIFGELIPTWEYLVSEECNYFIMDQFIRRDFYDADWVKIWAVRAIEANLNVNNPSHEDKI